MPPKLTTTKARQGTGPRAMFWVLIGSLTLAVIAGLALGPTWPGDPPRVFGETSGSRGHSGTNMMRFAV